MQQPIPSMPALPPASNLHGHQGQVLPARFDATELDLGYEVAFPFLTENKLTDTE